LGNYSREGINSRLDTLGTSLARFPEGAACPWPVARIFNELVKQARQEVDDDPVLKSIRFLEESADEAAAGMSNALVSTVRALVDQVALSVTPPAPVAPDTPAPGAPDTRDRGPARAGRTTSANAAKR